MTIAVRQTSPASPRFSLSDKLSALGARIGRMSRNDDRSSINSGSDRSSLASTLAEKEQNRSLSRGREAFHSSGRGGLGNMRQASASREARTEGPDDFSSSRGREPAVISTTKVFSTGRGGAGNIRSPSRDVKISPVGPDIVEEEVIRSHRDSVQDAPRSTGRGGIGNVSGRSRSRARDANSHPVHSTGRGGAGNIVAGDSVMAELNDEAERRKRTHVDGIHSTGRGGAANLTSIPGPAIEQPRHAQANEFSSTGRGGAGNMVHGRSLSRDRT